MDLHALKYKKVQKSFKYDVFLSFRGEDTRKNFVDHLYHALHQKGIITYKDDETIEKGERISEQLITSIHESRYYIIVFSKNYASSSWCLDELLKIMECQKMTEHTAYPIFYDVEPTEVRNQSGSVGEAFAKHVDKEFAGKWRDALKEAADLAGWELKTTLDGHEAKFIQKIVVDISLKLSFINWSVDENLVGMETRVKNVVSSLEIGFDDIRMIGIKGIGGGGKTTLATAVFDHISTWFEGVSFVENVREVSKSSSSGLKELQKQVLADVLNDQKIVVKSISEGKYKMKKMMASRKVLVVLDDVDNTGQLEALVGNPNWFKPGSRIIITTRDEQVLVAHRVNFIYDVNLLTHEEAICLFSRYAFAQEIPIQGYERLSRMVVRYAAGLPLTIKVLGSFLCGRIELEWVDTIERLKKIPLMETLEKLELSYNGLEDDQKEIFLEVACILKGEKKEKAIRILESCGFCAQIGLKVLEQKSLLTISHDDTLLLHDHIEEMGKNIVRRLHPEEPNKHSRLWIEEEIEDILINDLGTEATRSIKMDLDLDPAIIMNGLRKMKKLKLLDVSNAWIQLKLETNQDAQYLPNTLESLHWYNYSFCYLPKTFQANKLVNLEMVESKLSQLWEGGERKVLNKLKFLDLSHSNLRTLNLGMTPHLEKLNLEECNDFVELNIPVQCPKLKLLNLSGSKVSTLNLWLTPHLESLILKGCSYLQEIHAPAGFLKKLVYFNLSGCWFEYFLLDKLYTALTLDLTAESLDICPLHPNNNLPKFLFKCKYDEAVSLSSGNLGKLISFGPCACTNLESFSTYICGLQFLRKLTLEGCLLEVPKDLYQLASLEELTLSLKEIKHLPDSICMLKHLRYLNLKSCWLLEQLPKDLGRLECLENLQLTDCISLRDIPNSICKMKSLTYLDLCYCVLVEKLPKDFGCLTSLEELNIKGTGIRHLPQSIFQLKGLFIVGSRWRLESYGLTSLLEISKYTASFYIKHSQEESSL